MLADTGSGWFRPLAAFTSVAAEEFPPLVGAALVVIGFSFRFIEQSVFCPFDSLKDKSSFGVLYGQL